MNYLGVNLEASVHKTNKCLLRKRFYTEASRLNPYESKEHPLQGTVEVDEMVVGQQEENVVGRANKKKKLVIVGIEKKGKGISRMYAKVITDGSEESFKPFFTEYIDSQANIRTDGWSTYQGFLSKY